MLASYNCVKRHFNLALVDLEHTLNFLEMNSNFLLDLLLMLNNVIDDLLVIDLNNLLPWHSLDNSVNSRNFNDSS